MALTEPQTRALALTLEGLPSDRVGELVGVAGSTVRQWRSRPDFRAEWERQSRALAEARMAGLRDRGVSPAIKALIEVATDPNAANADRVRASVEILRFSGLKPAERQEIDLTAHAEEMSPERARQVLEQARRAHVVEPTPLPAPAVIEGDMDPDGDSV